MNRKQKIVLWIGIIIFVLMGLFPPGRWQTITNPYTIFEVRGEIISYGKLLIQWAIVAVVTGGLIYTFKDQKDKKTKDEQKE